MSSTKQLARNAGIWYVLACFTAPFAMFYVPGRLMVAGDAAATAHNLRTSETLLRLGIGAELLSAVLFIVTVFALHRLFKDVNERLSLAMIVLYTASVPISFLNVVNSVAALIFARSAPFLSGFDASQRDALAYLFYRLHGVGNLTAMVFWGLWLFPFAILVRRSGFIPPILGVFLMMAGCGYVISSCTSLLLPQYAKMVAPFALVMECGELPIVLWLLIRGAREQRSAPPVLAPAT